MKTSNLFVLILVLMEWLQAISECLNESDNISLNPCSDGMASSSDLAQAVKDGFSLCLNPCSDGMASS